MRNIHLARICYEESIRIFTEINSYKVKHAQSLLAQIDGVEENAPEVLIPDQMIELTYDVVGGDKLARAELLPWLDYIKNHPDQNKDISNI